MNTWQFEQDFQVHIEDDIRSGAFVLEQCGEYGNGLSFSNLSESQPDNLPILYPEAYLSGVLKGDGYCTRTIGLLVKDKDFADTFILAIYHGFQVLVVPHLHQGKYWYTRASNYTGKYTYLLTFEPRIAYERAAWLRGLFDSEGNAQLTKASRGVNCYWRRIAMYSTTVGTLDQASIYLQSLAITSTIRATKNSQGHKGDKTVYELVLKGGKDNYERFLNKVGSSIARKQVAIEAIVQSYVSNLSESCRQNQLKGAAVRQKNTMEITLPRVIDGIKELIQKGVKPTAANCRVIPGFNTVRCYFRQAELVTMAMMIES
jgi:LAGLIDADG-like domain